MSEDNSKFEAELQEIADSHFDLMRLVDKVQVIIHLKNALTDTGATIDGLVSYIHAARHASYKMGRGKTNADHGS
tara:strand:+ start:971 stop:1195 length:225 start_codon:yes stop_codon:yes gene_type:complete